MKGNENTDCFYILFSTFAHDVKHNEHPDSIFIYLIVPVCYETNNSQ